jgi:putative tricarboxylic transport membrane protein
VQRSDRWVGIALALLGLAVLWSARTFPNVPGQKLGAAFLPMLVGAGLLLCAVALLVRSWRGHASADADADEAAPAVAGGEHFGSSLVIIGVVLAYIFLSGRIGFLIIAPLCLLAGFMAFRIAWRRALLWAVVGTLVVHFAFYKLLRVPLPWGPITPFY